MIPDYNNRQKKQKKCRNLLLEAMYGVMDKFWCIGIWVELEIYLLINSSNRIQNLNQVSKTAGLRIGIWYSEYLIQGFIHLFIYEGKHKCSGTRHFFINYAKLWGIGVRVTECTISKNEWKYKLILSSSIFTHIKTYST